VDNTNFGSPSSTISEVESTFGDITARVQASEVGQRASEFGQRAVGGIQANADKMRTSASQVAQRTADGLGATASYMRENTMGDMLRDLGEYVKAHPTPALIGAICVGFLAGRTLRRH
jgi:ElaB/YqjD/DUF883 family membrane-anchored ribosome-binding protein